MAQSDSKSVVSSPALAQIKAGSAQLKLLRRDISQIFNYGKRLLENEESFVASMFDGMMVRVPDLYKEYMTVFSNTQTNAILSNCEASFPTEEDIKLRNEVNTLYYSINQFNQQKQAAAVVSPPASLESSFSQLAHINRSILHRSRLPNIEIPIFKGDLASWPKFKQLFRSVIHDDPDIPTIEKFHYLSTKLEGAPSALISELTLQEDNYTKAWDALVKRYDNKRLLANTYFEKVLDYNPPKTTATLDSLTSFIRIINENIAAFKSLSIQDEANFLWLSLALRKLDPDTRQRFEADQVRRDWPTYDSLIDFIHGRCKILQLTSISKVKEDSLLNTKVRQVKPNILATVVSKDRKEPCFVKSIQTNEKAVKNVCCCDEGHLLFQCPMFRDRSVDKRFAFLKGRRICFNCFRPGHLVYDCDSPKRCSICSYKHHTLLHNTNQGSSTSSVSSTPKTYQHPVASLTKPPPSVDNAKPKPSVVASVIGTTQILLGTAEVQVKDFKGILQPVRLVIDCGSQFSLMTANCAKRLGLTWKSSSHALQGAGRTPLPKIKGRLTCNIFSKLNPSLSLIAEPLVVNCITGNLPTVPVNSHLSKYIPSELADPQYWKPRQVDFLLGNDLFMRILTGDSLPDCHDGFGAIATIFGKVLMGEVPTNENVQTGQCLSLTTTVSNELISKFWESEELSLPLEEHPNDKLCEKHFVATHFRTPEGQYVVSLPFKHKVPDLSESKRLAMSRFFRLETKFTKLTGFTEKYREFLDEYEELGHMSPTCNPSLYVIPHHGVFKSTNNPDSKIRVVFDASLKTKRGSLNDHLMVGPKLHKDIVELILNFRRYRIAIVADLVKMFRNILLNPDHRPFQHILWRKDKSHPIQKYELNTITYGMSSSPYLAMRTIKQLKIDEGASYPAASKVLDREIYVDDIVSGANSLDEALVLFSELNQLLAKGGFTIHKWASNSEAFVKTVGTEDKKVSCSFSPKESYANKILGMAWDPFQDVFFFEIGVVNPKVTKRTILSTIARLFDPMGFLSPVIFYAKTILQQLWLSNLDWDDSPDDSTVAVWRQFVDELPKLSALAIPRFVLNFSSAAKQIIGFCDASIKGFAAAVYLRTVSSDGEIKVYLLKAKTRLAPIKTLSIPRLELSAAHLLVKLLCSIQSFYKVIDADNIYLFSDSTIVLAWLKMSPRQLQTFVSNRVSYILTHTNVNQWYHVPSESNPADVASRGVLPQALLDNTLWWNGSDWLSQEPIAFPQSVYLPHEIPEVKPNPILLTYSAKDISNFWLVDFGSKFSKYLKMLRTLAYVRRFLSNISKSKVEKMKGPLSCDEINSSLQLCIKSIQHKYFASEFDWTNNQPLSKHLQVLAAFQDKAGILRVGGRLRNSALRFAIRHPILLPANIHFVNLIIDHYHHTFFHLGPKALQNFLQREFWIFRLRQTVKNRVHRCVICHKMTVRPTNPYMGDLPPSRVLPNSPFHSSGVDYAGPFSIKLGSRRNSPVGKAYLCLFICMATKAVHLEVVSSLSTQCFMAAFDRFVGRRGLPSDLFSDCGANFIGASREIADLYRWLKTASTQEAIVNATSSRGITWHFNPPYSPHFGGLWEAAVKSAKSHMYKVLVDRVLSFEELSTLFIRIEAVLNSRPLCALPTSDIEAGDYLSPGHFLIGRPLITLPEKDTTEFRLNTLSRWQLVQNSVQHIWKRWQAEYLQTLQKRSKWFHPTRSIQTGDLVLYYDKNTSPLKWKSARVVECFPGSDGINRVVSIKDKNGTYRRSVHKLVPLFFSSADSSSNSCSPSS